MKKRVYRAIRVQKINGTQLSAMVQGKRIAIGVDNAKQDQFAAVMIEGGTVLVTMKWKHPMETAEVVELFKALPASELDVVMESSGRYGDAIRAQLEDARLEVYLVSAKRVHDAAEVYDGVPSMHDAKAAAIIAKLHFDGATRRWPEMSEQRRSLAAAVSTMEMFAGQYQRNLNRHEAELARTWPEITQEIALTRAPHASPTRVDTPIPVAFPPHG